MDWGKVLRLTIALQDNIRARRALADLLGQIAILESRMTVEERERAHRRVEDEAVIERARKETS